MTALGKPDWQPTARERRNALRQGALRAVARRRGLAAALLGRLRPESATGAAITPLALRIEGLPGPTEIPLGQVRKVRVDPGVGWSSLHFEHAGGQQAFLRQRHSLG